MSLKSGDKAPAFEALDVNGKTQTPFSDGDQDTLLVFFRHAGCPPCNLRMRELIQAKEELSEHNIKVLGVFESTPNNIRNHLEHSDVPYPILPDRQRELYKKYFLSTSLIGFIKSMLIKPKKSMIAMFKYGYMPKIRENTTMMPAEFLIDSEGTIKLAYYGTDIGDFMNLNTIYDAAATPG